MTEHPLLTAMIIAAVTDAGLRANGAIAVVAQGRDDRAVGACTDIDTPLAGGLGRRRESGLEGEDSYTNGSIRPREA